MAKLHAEAAQRQAAETKLVQLETVITHIKTAFQQALSAMKTVDTIHKQEKQGKRSADTDRDTKEDSIVAKKEKA